MKIRAGSAWREITSGKVYANGAWRTLVNGKAYINGAWRDIFNFTGVAPGGDSGGGGATITVAFDTPGGTQQSGTSDTMPSPTVTAVPSGGLAPYTYQWILASSDGKATYTINTPTNASTYVIASGMWNPDTYICRVRVTATDVNGSSGVSAELQLRWTKTDPPTGGGDAPNTSIP